MSAASAPLQIQNAVARVGIVIPTLGERPESLRESMESVLAQEQPVICILVGPAKARNLAYEYALDSFDDAGGLSASINLGVSEMPDSVEFVGWLGDDDLLVAGSASTAMTLLQRNPEAVGVYGACEYIDEQGRHLWTNRFGGLAKIISRVGPNVMPQPGMLFRRDAWEMVGGLDPQLRYAMDLDICLRMLRLGPILAHRRTGAKFRWHPESLTVGNRDASLAEAHRVRMRNGSPLVKAVATVARKPVATWTTRSAGILTRAAQRSE